MKILSPNNNAREFPFHATKHVGSHSFNVPYYILAFLLNQVDRLVVKIIPHLAVRVGNHSFNVPYYILVFTLNRVDCLAVKFVCEDYLSPSGPRGESLLHYATLYYRAFTRQSLAPAIFFLDVLDHEYQPLLFPRCLFLHM